MKLEEAINKVKETLDESYKLFPEDSQWQPIVSVRNQLNYIFDGLHSKNDRSKLGEINLGLYSVREFENNYDDFANLLYEVTEISTLMKKGKL